MTLAAASGFEKPHWGTRKAEFLARMERLMPWPEFCALIEPHYPKAGNGRPLMGLGRREKGAGNGAPLSLLRPDAVQFAAFTKKLPQRRCGFTIVVTPVGAVIFVRNHVAIGAVSSLIVRVETIFSGTARLAALVRSVEVLARTLRFYGALTEAFK